MDQESNQNQLEILHSSKVMRASSSNAYGCLIAFAALPAILAGILYAKSYLDKKPLSSGLETTMYISFFVFLILLIITIRYRVKSEFAFTVGKSTNGNIVITVNDPKEPKTIEGPFQIDYFFFKELGHVKPRITMNHLRLVIKKEEQTCLVIHDWVNGSLNDSVDRCEQIQYKEQFERYGNIANQVADYSVIERNQKICEKVIAILTADNES